MSDRLSSPLVQLTLARIREFIREPEAVFWAFVFPIVVSLALAFAFPSRAGRDVLVGLQPGATTESIRATLQRSPGIAIRDVRPDEPAAKERGSGWAWGFRRALPDADLGCVVLLGAGGAGSAIDRPYVNHHRRNRHACAVPRTRQLDHG